MERDKRRGLTTAELLVASTIAFFVIAGILALSEFSQSIWKGERAKANLLGKLEFAMERIREELRLTDGHQIFYYPKTGSTYSAISFPLGTDSDDDGFTDLTSDDPPKVNWGRTVIYHTYQNTATGKTELRRTLFTSRKTMTDAQRQAQLDDVAVNGYPTDTTSSEYAGWDQSTGTRAVCESDSIQLTVMPSARQFDGYSSSTTRSENVVFGSVRMDSGDHYITFTAVGTNSPSLKYWLGIDSFTITPSGCAIEAEEAEIRDHDGSDPINEDMSAYGSWSGNRQLEYRAAAAGDHVSLNFYYDRWVETNFSKSSPSGTSIEYSARTGDGDELMSGADDYVARLNGYGDSWSAQTQTGASAKGAESFDATGGMNFRNVIMSKNVDVEGRAIKIKFDNTQNTNDMEIDGAWIMTRSQPNSPDGVTGTAKQITFDCATPDTVTIAAGGTVESNWIDISNFDRSKDYLVSFHVPSGAHNVTRWSTPVEDTQDDHSYRLPGDISIAQAAVWPGGSFSSDISYAVESIKASYFSEGTLTSQVYDTGVDDPAYSTLSWNIAKNNYGDYEAATPGLGADLEIRVRSNDDEDALKAQTVWSATPIYTKSSVSGSADISSIGTGRYVQFQAKFISQPTPGKSDYTKSCVLKNLTIKWPGSKRVVDISGYFTRRPDYGIFSVKIDGRDLIKGLEINLSITENLSGGNSLTRYLTTEIQPRRTGK